MDDARKETFMTWLRDMGKQAGGDFARTTPDAHANKIGLVEGNLEINFDEIDSNRRQEIYDNLTNVTNDAERNQDQIDMGWDTTTSPDTISAIRDSIKKYRMFCGDTVA